MGCRDRRLGARVGVCCTAPSNPGGWRLAAAHTPPHELVYLCSGGGFGCETFRRSVHDSFICSQILEALVTRGRRGELCFTFEKFNFLCVKTTERPPCHYSSLWGRADRPARPRCYRKTPSSSLVCVIFLQQLGEFWIPNATVCHFGTVSSEGCW